MKATLILSDFQVPMNLGWGEAERAQTQTVSLDLEIIYASLPSGCETDQLDDTLCYDTLTQAIRHRLVAQSYRLIEHVAQTTYDLIMQYLHAGDHIQLRIAKQPPVEGLSQAVFQLSGEK